MNQFRSSKKRAFDILAVTNPLFYDEINYLIFCALFSAWTLVQVHSDLKSAVGLSFVYLSKSYNVRKN
jgi:hypothetical protein